MVVAMAKCRLILETDVEEIAKAIKNLRGDISSISFSKNFIEIETTNPITTADKSAIKTLVESMKGVREG